MHLSEIYSLQFVLVVDLKKIKKKCNTSRVYILLILPV